MVYRVVWYYNVENRLVREQPALAGTRAANEAAGLAALQIRSNYSGELARQVAVAHPVGALTWLVGSSLPYAAIEHFGGEIHVRTAPYLAIGMRRGAAPGVAGARSNVGGAVTFIGPGPPPRLTASGRDFVIHRGKGYLYAATTSFPGLFMSALRALGG